MPPDARPNANTSFLLRETAWSRRGVLLLLSLLFALSFGVQYGRSDHQSYLLQPLRMLDSSLLQRDWYTSQIAPHHPAFTRLVWAASLACGPRLAAGFLQVLFMAAMAGVLYAMLGALTPRAENAFPAALACMAALGGGVMLSHPFFMPWILPTQISSLLTLAGVAFLMHSNARPGPCFAAAGLCFGAAALLHATFYILLPPFLCVVLCVMGLRHRRRNLFLLAAYALASAPMTLWMARDFFFSTAGSVPVMYEIMRWRAPHHLLPALWGWKGFSPFAAALALGAIGWALRRRPLRRPPPALTGAVLGLALMFACLFTLTVPLVVPAVSLLQGFRAASLLAAFAPLALGLGWAETVSAFPRFFRRRSVPSSLAALSLFIAAMALLEHANKNAALALAAAAMAAACLLRWKPGLGNLAVRGPALAAVTLFLALRAGAALPGSSAWVPETDSRTGLYSWIQSSTPKDAVFLTPPMLGDFRLRARRAAMVDWKGMVFRPSDTAEWRRRYRLLTGNAAGASASQAAEGFYDMDSERAQKLAAEFGASFLLTEIRRHRGDLSALPLAYSDGAYAVYRIPPPPSPPLTTPAPLH